MTGIAIIFSSAETANHLVAGVPAAARAAHRASLSGRGGARNLGVIVVPGGWTPSAWCEQELRRLAPDFRIQGTPERRHEDSQLLAVSGEAVIAATDFAQLVRNCRTRAAGDPSRPAPWDITVDSLSLKERLALLDRAGSAIIAATGKPTDGIVSRYVNRPISQAITRSALRFPGVQPIHATLAAALLGVIMAFCLISGGQTGLIAGALLFQAASIVDGVDGEIARATFRSSGTGAALDSITDAATNLAFIACVTLNLWYQGLDEPALAGAIGLAILITGLCMIGAAARARGGPFSFDIVKQAVNTRQSTLMQWLTWLTMRDFFAAAGAVLIVFDMAAVMLVLFTVAASIWLIVTLAVLAWPLLSAVR